MKGDGEGESEGARKNDYGNSNNDIKVSRRRFVKTSAAFSAAVAGIPPYNLVDIGDVFLKEDGELMMYPVIYESKHELVRKLPFGRFIGIYLFGGYNCNCNCRWCSEKSQAVFKNMMSMEISVDQITGLLLSLGNDTPSTMVVIGGGEPLLQREEVLKLIESLKTNTDYTVMLATNGSLFDENFIDEANDLGLNGIMIYFPYLADGWHKWYTGGHSTQSTIDALKLVSKKFKGQTVVSLSAELDAATFENMCKFLHEINPNFVIRTHCGQERDYHKTEKVWLHYSMQVDQTSYFSKQIKMIRYQIVGNESGNMKLVKSKEIIHVNRPPLDKERMERRR